MNDGSVSEIQLIETVTTATARAIVAEGMAEAGRCVDAVSVVVLNRLGTVLAAETSDRAPAASFDVALAKARHSIRFNRPTSYQDDLLSRGAFQVLAVPGMLPLAGGCPLHHEGVLVGAIGVSGASSTRDEEIARIAAGPLSDEYHTSS